MNLKKLNVQELNNKELQETEGGILPLIMGIATVTAAVYYGGKEIGKAAYYLTH
ncbi:class IIb bacteriocin, lactobin A/cerein 7B family [Chryseobacterium sp. MYb264]|uniref:class IIb bacteriocin, lactobin A/cerein 7B family n=1 Tax=Chryseobacterium sp. MYb264 TaxID=2745153 RepID=UPI002E1451F5|nr:class IIb bacteriocin, lactobin A/cerein 7B family [Chryseobacterium sp. MYb264]